MVIDASEITHRLVTSPPPKYLLSPVERGIKPPFYNDAGYSIYFPTPKFHPMTGADRIPPLRIGRIDELELANNKLNRVMSEKHQSLRDFIRGEYGPLKTPVYVFDYHNLALFGWCEAFVEGRIAKGATLLHFDSHPDEYIPDEKIPDLNDLEYISKLARKLNHAEFIGPALESGLIGRVIVISPGLRQDSYQRLRGKPEEIPFRCVGIESPYLQSIIDRSHPQNLIVDWDADYFENHTHKPDLLREVRGKEDIPIDKLITDDLGIIQKAARKAGVITVATTPPSLNATNEDHERENYSVGFMDQREVIKRAFA